jgi:hypothetical protein
VHCLFFFANPAKVAAPINQSSTKSSFKGFGSFWKKPSPQSNGANYTDGTMDRKTLEKKLNDKLTSELRGAPPSYVKSPDARKTANYSSLSSSSGNLKQLAISFSILVIITISFHCPFHSKFEIYVSLPYFL